MNGIQIIVEYLSQNRFVDLIEWAKNTIDHSSSILSTEEKKILNYISKYDYDNLINYLEKLNYSQFHSELSFPYQLFQQLKNLIKKEWKNARILHSINDKDIINLIVNEDILIYKKNNQKEKKRNNKYLIRTIADLRKLAKITQSPDYIFNNSQLYQIKSYSKIQILENNIRQAYVHKEYIKFQKFEKIAQFINSLNNQMQELFSQNQIGVIIHNKQIYLVKWVQYLNEDQLLGAENVAKDNVVLLDNFGTKIGVQIKENFDLGDLVIFSSKSNPNTISTPNSNSNFSQEQTSLTPLFSLNEDLFQHKIAHLQKKDFDFNKYEDCKDFINLVLARIETGILLLKKELKLQLKDRKDLDLYIDISLQRVETLTSITGKINLLRDLLNLNQNPQYHKKIIEKLELNYLFYLKKKLYDSEYNNLLSILQLFIDLGLYQEDKKEFLNTFRYITDSVYIPPDIIIKSVEFIIKNWELSNEELLLLEPPQITAISSKIMDFLIDQEFDQIIKFIREYIQFHPYLSRKNIILLSFQVLLSIYNPLNHAPNIKLTQGLYLELAFDIQEFIIKEFNELDNEQKNEIKAQLEEYIVYMAQNVNILSYLQDYIYVFMQWIYLFPDYILSFNTKFKLLQKFIEIIPDLTFQLKNMNLSKDLLIFLNRSKSDEAIIIEFITRIFSLTTLNNNNEILSLDFIEYLEFMKEIKKWIYKGTIDLKEDNSLKNVIVHQNKYYKILKRLKKINKKTLITKNNHNKKFYLPEIYYRPIKDKLKKIFNRWYLSGELPQQAFTLHLEFMEIWVDFIGYRNKMLDMEATLYIKAVIWKAEEGNLEKYDLEFKKLPAFVWENKNHDLLLSLWQIIQKPFNNETQAKISVHIFNQIQQYFDQFNLTRSKIQLIISDFNKSWQISISTIIQKGDAALFKQVINLLQDNFIYLPLSFYKKIIESFIEIYDLEIKEAGRFVSRLDMMKSLSVIIKRILPDLDYYRNEKERFITNSTLLISKEDLQQTLAELDSGAYHLFIRSQKWLKEIGRKEYLVEDNAFKPLKIIFSNVIEQFIDRSDEIFEDFMVLCEDIFKDQIFLNDNKKHFYKMILNLLKNKISIEFENKIRSYSDYVNELGDIQANYFTIRKDNIQKIEMIQERVKNLLDEYPHFFSPWHIYGTCLAIRGSYSKAIFAFNNALKYKTNEGNLHRLYNNLLICYLKTEKYAQAQKTIESMELGIRTYPKIRQLIEEINRRASQ